MCEDLNILHFTVELFKGSIVKESVVTQQKFMPALETLSPLTQTAFLVISHEEAVGGCTKAL